MLWRFCIITALLKVVPSFPASTSPSVIRYLPSQNLTDLSATTKVLCCIVSHGRLFSTATGRHLWPFWCRCVLHYMSVCYFEFVSRYSTVHGSRVQNASTVTISSMALLDHLSFALICCVLNISGNSHRLNLLYNTYHALHIISQARAP